MSNELVDARTVILATHDLSRIVERLSPHEQIMQWDQINRLFLFLENAGKPGTRTESNSNGEAAKSPAQ